MLKLNVTTRAAKRIIPVLAVLWLLASCSQPEPPQLAGGTLLPSTRTLKPFTLVDHHKQPFTQDSLSGQWSFVFFGYTHCPDICPTALGKLKHVQTLLKVADRKAPPAQVVFISLDPARDTPTVLARYVSAFDPGFVGVTGKDAQLKHLTSQLGVHYERSPGGSDGDYQLTHSAAVFLFNPQGRYQALFSAPQDPEKIARDFTAIRHWYAASR